MNYYFAFVFLSTTLTGLRLLDLLTVNSLLSEDVYFEQDGDPAQVGNRVGKSSKYCAVVVVVIKYVYIASNNQIVWNFTGEGKGEPEMTTGSK